MVNTPDTDRLAALLPAAIWPELPQSPWADTTYAGIAARLIAAGVTLAPTPPDAPVLGNPCRVCGEPAVVAYTLCGHHATSPIPHPLAGYEDAPPPAPLDVERLARAYNNVVILRGGKGVGIPIPQWDAIAREYAALAQPKEADHD